MRDRPGFHLAVGGGEKGNQPQQLVRLFDNAVEPGLGQPEISAELCGRCFIQLAELHFQLATKGDDAGFLLCLTGVQFRFKFGCLWQLFLSDVDHDEQRFGGEELVAGEHSGIGWGQR